MTISVFTLLMTVVLSFLAGFCCGVAFWLWGTKPR